MGLKWNLCTVRKPFASFSGQKHEFAKKWAIKIVRPQWLYDSVEKGHCCDAVKYKVEETSGSGSGEGEGQRTSTPNRGSEGLCEYKKSGSNSLNNDVGTRSSDIF